MCIARLVRTLIFSSVIGAMSLATASDTTQVPVAGIVAGPGSQTSRAELWLTVLLVAALVTVQLRRKQKSAMRDRVTGPPLRQSAEPDRAARARERSEQPT